MRRQGLAVVGDAGARRHRKVVQRLLGKRSDRGRRDATGIGFAGEQIADRLAQDAVRWSIVGRLANLMLRWICRNPS
jgi:hypothetical protein